MAFKRMEGFAGSVPQSFIDNRIKVCPFCGTTYPHWHIDMKMQMKLEGNLYLFQCEQCKGVLSSPVPDVTGYNKSVLSTGGLLKKMSGKKNGVIYIRIYDLGLNPNSGLNLGQEFTLEAINNVAQIKLNQAQQQNPNPNQNLNPNPNQNPNQNPNPNPNQNPNQNPNPMPPNGQFY